MAEIVVSGGVRYRKQDAERLGVKADQTVTTTETGDRDKTTFAHNAGPDSGGGVISTGGNGDADTNGAGGNTAGETGGSGDADETGAASTRTGAGSKKSK